MSPTIFLLTPPIRNLYSYLNTSLNYFSPYFSFPPIISPIQLHIYSLTEIFVFYILLFEHLKYHHIYSTVLHIIIKLLRCKLVHFVIERNN